MKSTDDLQSVRKLLHEVQSCKVQILCTCWCILAKSCCKIICNRYSAPPRRVPTLWIPVPGHVQRHQEDEPGKCGCFLNAECEDGDLRWKKHLFKTPWYRLRQVNCVILTRAWNNSLKIETITLKKFEISSSSCPFVLAMYCLSTHRLTPCNHSSPRNVDCRVQKKLKLILVKCSRTQQMHFLDLLH